MIYCVEDDKSIRDLIIYALKSDGFDAIGFSESKAFYKAVNESLPTMVLLDIMLPGEDGIEILKKLKSSSKTKSIPVILITAKGSEYDKVIGLDSGADDYIAKPFGIMELLSRIKAVLRRVGNSEQVTELTINDLVMNLERHTVYVGDKKINLTLKEFNLLKYLLENINIVLSREKILEKVWEYEYEGETRTVDVHIRTLRRKLGESGALIETVRGVGYRIGG